MAGSPLLCGPRAGGVGLLVLLLLGLLRLPPALSARPIKEPRSLSAALAPLAETGTPRRLRRAVPRGEAAGAVQELARALAHLLMAERQERARAEAQEAEDQQARVLAQLLRVWGSTRASDPPLAPGDDPDAPAALLARALLRARLDLAALAAQFGPAPAAALRPRPPVYDDGPTGPDVEDTGDETPDVDPELLRYLLGRILTGSSEPEAAAAAAPRRLRRAVDQDSGPQVPPESVLGALLRVKRLENSSPQAPARRLLPP